jgi:hypothetical protein
MSSEYPSRIKAIWTLIKLSKCIETYFIRVTWPIVNQDPNSGNQREEPHLNTSAVNQYNPKLEIIQVEQAKILKLIENVLARARNMFEEIFT